MTFLSKYHGYCQTFIFISSSSHKGQMYKLKIANVEPLASPGCRAMGSLKPKIEILCFILHLAVVVEAEL